MKKLLPIFLIAFASIAATVGWQNRNFVADTFQFTGGSVRTNFGPIPLNIDIGGTQDSGITGNEDFQTYTLPANTLTATGDYIEIVASGSITSNSSVANMVLLMNGFIVAGSNQDFIQNSGRWIMKAKVFRDTSTTGFTNYEYFITDGDDLNQIGNNSSVGAGRGFPMTWANPLIIKIQVQADGSANATVTSDALVVTGWKAGL